MLLDASVLVKCFFNEPNSDKASEIVNDTNNEIYCPDIIYTEVANTFFKKIKSGIIPLKEGLNSFQYLYDIKMTAIYSPHYLKKAIELAHKINHNSIYDLVYFTIAESYEMNMLTADNEFVKKIRKVKSDIKVFSLDKF